MRKRSHLLVVIFIFGIFLFNHGLNSKSTAGIETYDVIIKNARVLDGSLKPAFRSDVAIKGDTIVKVARSIKGTAGRVINAKGLYLSPGFIDLHTHVDRNMYFPEGRSCLNYLKQGVTSVVVGQCGRSAWPIFDQAKDLMELWSREGIGPNAALLIGHGQVREMVMGMENREPTAEELEKMKSLVKEAMEQGAYGLSTGLQYLPGRYGKTDEVIELVKVIVPYGGIYHTHMRDEAAKLIEAVEEAIIISREAGAATHISHFKAVGRRNWGLVKEACAVIEEARSQGLKITADQYPYRFSSGNPYRSLIPTGAWVGTDGIERFGSSDVEGIFSRLRDDHLIDLYKKVTPYAPLSENHQKFLDSLSRERLVEYIGQRLLDTDEFRGPESARERKWFLERMQDPEKAEQIREQVKKYIDNMTGPENFVVGICVEKNLEGKTLKQVASIKKKSYVDAAIELELMGAKCIPFRMSEEDIEYIMNKDYAATGSDGTTPFYGIGIPHIRSYSTFLHKIKKYASQRKAVSLHHVIRSQTSLAAEIMNWEDRGWIKEGKKADIVIFDLKNIKTNTSISNPHRYSEGVKYLVINGELVIDKGKWNGELPGKIIKSKKT